MSRKIAINFATPIEDEDFEGTPLRRIDRDPAGNVLADHGPYTLGFVTRQALLARYPEDDKLPLEDMETRFFLARDIAKALGSGHGVLELDPKEAENCRKMVAKFYGTLIAGQAAEIFSGKRATVPEAVLSNGEHKSGKSAKAAAH